jgi:hypothetical protein
MSFLNEIDVYTDLCYLGHSSVLETCECQNHLLSVAPDGGVAHTHTHTHC